MTIGPVGGSGSTTQTEETDVVDPLNKPAPLFSGDTINKDEARAILEIAVTVGSSVLDYIRTLFDLSRRSDKVAALLDAAFFNAGLPTLSDLEDYVQDVYLPFVEDVNEFVDEYNILSADLQTESSAIAVDGESFTDGVGAPLLDGASQPILDHLGSPLTFDGADAELAYLEGEYQAAVATWNSSTQDAAAEQAFRDAVDPIFDQVNTIYAAMSGDYNALANNFSNYEINVQNYSDVLTNTTVDSADWDAYNEDLADLSSTFFPKPPDLPDSTFLSDIPTPFVAPGSPLIDENLSLDDPTGQPPASIIAAAGTTFGSMLTNSSTALTNLQDASTHYAAISPTIEQANLLPTIIELITDPTAEDYIGNLATSQYLQAAVALIAEEVSKFIAELTDLNDFEFLDILKFLTENRSTIDRLVFSATGTTALVGLAAALPSKLDEIFALSLADDLFREVVFGQAYVAESPVSSRLLASLSVLLTINGAVSSILGASKAFTQLTQFESDLNNLDTDLRAAVFNLETFNTFIETSVDPIENQLRREIEAFLRDNGGDISLAQGFSKFYIRKLISHMLAQLASAVGLPSAFLPSSLVGIYSKALIDDSEHNNQLVQDQKARAIEADRFETILASFKDKLEFKAGVDESAMVASAKQLGLTDAEARQAAGSLGDSLEGVQGPLSYVDLQRLLNDAYAKASPQLAGDNFAANFTILKFNENLVDSRLQTQNLFADNANLTTKDQQTLVQNLTQAFRGKSQDQYVGHLEKSADLVRQVKDEGETTKTIVKDERENYNRNILPESWRYNQMLQQDGMQFLNIGLVMKTEGDNPVYTASVRNTIQPI